MNQATARAQELVKVVAVHPVYYMRRRMPGEEFEMKRGFADFFVNKKLVRLPEDPVTELEERSHAAQALREAAARAPRKRTKVKKDGTYKRRDLRSEK